MSTNMLDIDEEEIDDDEPMEVGVDKDESIESKSIRSEEGEKLPSFGSSRTPSTTPEPRFPPPAPLLMEDYTCPANASSHDLTGTYAWDIQLPEVGFLAAPVSTFQHAPLADCWEKVMKVGMKVEVENTDMDPGSRVAVAYWIATVLKIQGYKAQLRYEGFGQDGAKDFFMNLCSDKVHPVGWCATKGKPLIPPKTIQTKYSDWKEFLVKRLTGARTLPGNFYNKVWESVGSLFRRGMALELVDKMRISQVRVANVVDITGRRLRLSYSGDSEDGFWCHEESPLINPVGWARRVGHQIEASQGYHDRCALETYLDTDCTTDMFPEYRQPSGSFVAGMKLEAVDPLNLATICVATVMKVLRMGYIMIRIDGYEVDRSGGDWFCYHASSPVIFPPGFCEQNDINLKVPAGHEGEFEWSSYLELSKSVAAPTDLFSHKDDCKHGFLAGMKVECTDLMDPKLVCVGTISRVVGRLLRVHFDGWVDFYDQWMDCECVDIYPVGWAELVGHRLEAPKVEQPLQKMKTGRGRGRPGRKPKEKKEKPVGKRKPDTVASSPGDVEDLVEPASGGTSVGDPMSRSPTPEIPTPEAIAEEAPALVEIPMRMKEEILMKEENVWPALPTLPALPVIEELVKEEPEMPVLKAETSNHYIPLLVDAAGNTTPHKKESNLEPSEWTVVDMGEFLKINECSNLVEAFAEKSVDGATFINMDKSGIMALVNNKIGPCLKLENLLALLKTRLNPAQARLLASVRKK